MKKNVIKNPNHAVGYCRYSSENQSETSIEAQKIEISKYAKAQNLIITDWYIDRAQSGTTDNRKEFRRMIEDSIDHDFSKVLVYQTDRFARSKEDHVMYKFDLRRNGVKVVSVVEHFDNSPEGFMMESMIEVMSAYYSKDLSRKTTRGLKLNASKAQSNGGKVLYGYKLVPRLDQNGNVMFHRKGHELHDVAIDPEKTEAVKIMFDMTLQGKKRCEIIKRLNELGYKRDNGKSFVGTSLDNILRNERYTGTYLYDSNKKKRKEHEETDKEIIRVENALPQIISKETFDAVQNILAGRIHRSPVNTEEKYLLSGKIFCGECGKPYIGYRQSKQYLYYKCGNQTSYKNGERSKHYCHNNSVRKEDIEKYVIKQVEKIIFNERIIDEVLEEYYYYEKEAAVNHSLIDLLEKQLNDIDLQIKNIVNTISMGCNSEAIMDKLRSLEAAKKVTAKNLEKEKGGNDYTFATESEIKKVYEKAKLILEKGTFEEQKELLNNFINKIFVYKNTVEIYLNLVPRMLIGFLDMEIKNRHYTTIADLTPKQKITENENGVFITENPVYNEKQSGSPIVLGASPFTGENSIGSSDRT